MNVETFQHGYKIYIIKSAEKKKYSQITLAYWRNEFFKLFIFCTIFPLRSWTRAFAPKNVL